MEAAKTALLEFRGREQSAQLGRCSRRPPLRNPLILLLSPVGWPRLSGRALGGAGPAIVCRIA